MSIIGHELRTPLTVVRGAATLVLQAHEQLPPERLEEMLKLIDDNAQNMAERIEDMLSVSHLDARDLRLNLTTVAVAELVEAAVESVRRLGRGQVTVSGDAAGVAVEADRDRGVQALRSLLAEALRESGRSSSSELRLTSSQDEVRFEVDAAAPSPSHPSRARSAAELESGADLGLYLASGLVAAMGGRLGTESREDGTARLWFTLRRHG